ncbi:hypothetical protein HPP92_021125 [Vanilla planifolia]|uniref:Uncharacterized protein n=1 Tax=Vanilla planifolia TaxID=51239 RepID=A0A835PXJ0_VANPL|nr:hypothetical protein HPP92_021125 [Vanilla planifolia]
MLSNPPLSLSQPDHLSQSHFLGLFNATSNGNAASDIVDVEIDTDQKCILEESLRRCSTTAKQASMGKDDEKVKQSCR